MKIGIIKEGKTPPDKRVGLTPAHCTHLKQAHPELEIKVQRSPIRCFKDDEYAAAGIELVDNVNDCATPQCQTKTESIAGQKACNLK